MDSIRRTKKRPVPKPEDAAFGVSKSRVDEKNARRLFRIFTALVRDSGGRCAILLETTGALLAKLGDAGTLKLHTIASLLAAELAVAHAVAKHFGGEFSLMLHHSKHDNIQIAMAGKGRVLALIFGSDAVLANVVAESRRAALVIEALLPKTAPRMPSPPPEREARRTQTRTLFGREFVEAAKSRIDELLQ